MKLFILILFSALLCSCSLFDESPRIIEDFNSDWKFSLSDDPNASIPNFDDSNWRSLNVPHDWSIELGYQQQSNTAASTGFVPGGIGWYRKTFYLPESDIYKRISVVFDGIYNNSSVWINGHFLGKRPYGYSTFSYNLSSFLKYGNEKNVIAVKVNRTAFADSRWYTGSGIYRKVRLIKTNKIHVEQWGLHFSTSNVTEQAAQININASIVNDGSGSVDDVELQYFILNKDGECVGVRHIENQSGCHITNSLVIQIDNPILWTLDTPNLYTAIVKVFHKGKLVDEVHECFGIRWFDFDANKGFSLNGKAMKLKGVNLHHDAGAVGAAVPKALWEYRIRKLKAIGVNAIRCSHNPHAKELIEACDKMGMLVIGEAFGEWNRPKKKGIVCAGDGKGNKEATKAYPQYFNDWAERDLKDLIRRDFNHPSIIMWSIGNEIEWIYPYYKETFNKVNGNDSELFYYENKPIYDSLKIKQTFNKRVSGEDTLVLYAKQLSNWVKEIDNTRPVTCGSVHPSISIASGYAKNVDVLGFNYRAVEYDAAHKAYPKLKILGSENWGNYNEWKSCLDRDFVAGIFVWTGFAYLGEAGPWPRKGLNISFFDFAGFKNPRGHFYECLWNDKPKVYLCTVPASESEYDYSEEKGWSFKMKLTPPPFWKLLRLWEWHKGYDKWKYTREEPVIVQAYTNCDEVELFLNKISLGRKLRSNFAEDNIIKWLVPYADGTLTAKGFIKGELAEEYTLKTSQLVDQISIESNKSTIKADGYDVTVITIKLEDQNETLVTDDDQLIEFIIEGPGINIGVDNGWERNVQSHKSNKIKTHQGKAVLYIQSTKETGEITIKAKGKRIESKLMKISSIISGL